MCSWNSLDENTQSRFLFWIAHSYVEDSDNEPPAGLYFFLFDSSFSLFIRWIIRSTNYAIFYTVYEKNIEKIGKRETRSYYSTRYFLHPRIGERCAIPVGVRGNDFKRFQNISSSVRGPRNLDIFTDIFKSVQDRRGFPWISIVSAMFEIPIAR